ncbi:MAG: hypothetical protein V4484_13160 [Pseudomonadota bacterium]
MSHNNFMTSMIRLALLLLFLASQASASTLTTPTFVIEVTVNCAEGNVPCGDVTYVGTSKKTGNSITLRGKSTHSLCADRITPCQFLGYEFWNGKTYYRVLKDGRLQVTQGAQVLLDEEGTWQSTVPGSPSQVKINDDYARARSKLLDQGWQVDPKWGISGIGAQLTYAQYPEVLCGEGYQAACTGRFKKGGQVILLTINQFKKRLPVMVVSKD